MCNWSWTITAEGVDGKREHLATIRYGSRIREERIGGQEALRRALRHASSWANLHRDQAATIRIASSSCNGSYETVWPFLPEGPMVEPEQAWDESDPWFDDDEGDPDCLLWSAASDTIIADRLTKDEARQRVTAAQESEACDLTAFRKIEKRDGGELLLCVADSADGAYWRLRRKPLDEHFPTLNWPTSNPTTRQGED